MRLDPTGMIPMRRKLLATAVVVAGLAALAGPVALLVLDSHSQAAFSGEASARGRLSSATVDIEPGERAVPVSVHALAPGDRTTGSIEVVNVGTLPLHYALVIESDNTAAERWLRWDLWFSSTSQPCGGRTPPNPVVKAAALGGSTPRALFGHPEPGFDDGDRVLAPGERELICTAVALPLGAPDDVQGATITARFVVAAEQHLESGS